MRVTLVALALVVLLIALVATRGRPPVIAPSHAPLVGAHYYPWYDEQRWAGQPATFSPKLGRYASGNRDIAAQHIRWAMDADLDFFMVSCLAPGGTEARYLRSSLLPALEDAKFPFALHYETPIALGLRPDLPIDLSARLPDGTIAGDRMVEHFDQLADTYFSHPQYLRFEGKVVVMMYLVRNFENAVPYLTAVRERMARRGINLYLIADVMYWEPPGELDWPLMRDHFQAVTAYNMYHRDNFMSRVATQYEVTDRVARTHNLRMIPHVMPGYDDTRLRGPGRVTLDRRDGAYSREFCSLAGKFVRPDQPFLIVTTFNEWHEGTQLEPSVEHGDLYLRLTRELIGELRKG
jgi:hypothetical protein